MRAAAQASNGQIVEILTWPSRVPLRTNCSAILDARLSTTQLGWMRTIKGDCRRDEVFKSKAWRMPTGFFLPAGVVRKLGRSSAAALGEVKL